MSSTNFIIANIKLCIEISDDGNYKIHENRTHMDFQPCDDLPPIRKNEDGENIMQNILQMVSSSTNKIKWENDDNDFVAGNQEDNVSEYVEEDDEDDEDEDEEDDDEDEEDEDEGDEDEEDEDEEDEENEDDDEEEEEEKEESKEKKESNDKKEEEQIRVYNHEINTEPKKTSLTTLPRNKLQ
jgi:hypothetical protein